MDLKNLPPISIEDVRAELVRRKHNKFDYMFPDDGVHARHLYPKHLEFFKATATHKETGFIAANRVGKSEALTYAGTAFATGKYPHWWEGKRFDGPVNVLVAGETAKLVRDSIQQKFLGMPGDFGTGMIPKDCILGTTAKSGVGEAVDIVKVKHSSGAPSVIQFGSYDQGREAFQATARHVVLFDEEPPMAVYSEGLVRTMTTRGIVMAGFTPLKGMSEVILLFMPGGKMSL